MTTNPPGSEVRPVTAADIRQILVARTGADPDLLAGRDDTPLCDLDVDSLAALELQAAVASRFGVDLPEDVVDRTVSDAVAYLNARLGQGAAR